MLRDDERRAAEEDAAVEAVVDVVGNRRLPVRSTRSSKARLAPRLSLPIGKPTLPRRTWRRR